MPLREQIPKQTQINIHDYEPMTKKMQRMHEPFRLMCGTSLHIQSCCVFAYRDGSWQRHLRAT